MGMAFPLGLYHVKQAAARLQQARVPRTPVLRSAWVDDQIGVKVHFKVFM